jgi:uncharacterized protein (TIGR02117 family)
VQRSCSKQAAGIRIAPDESVRAVLITLLAVTAAGCGERALSVWPPSGPHLPKDVWVVRHSWHTRIAVARSDVDPSIWPESRELGEVEYLEVGWGDRDFYPEPDPSIWDALDPIIRPTPAALHVGGFDRSPPEFLPESPIVRVRVSTDGFARLTGFIHEHYVHRADGSPVRIRPGYYPRSWFYLAKGRYHVLNNSNNWTLKALREAGAPVAPRRAVTAGNVIAQAEDIGERVDTGHSVSR